MHDITTKILLGDSREVLKTIKDNTIDLIVTSPPYADRRKNTYGGIKPKNYVEWFLPISEQLLRVLKPTGTVCNNKNHSAAFPKELPEWFINLFTREYDWVLDPFLGSGTTVDVAQRMNRNSIGIEIVPEYVEMAKSKIKEVKKINFSSLFPVGIGAIQVKSDN